MLYTLRFFSLQNAVCFIMLACFVPVLFKFYIQSVLKLKKNNSGAKWLIFVPCSVGYFNLFIFHYKCEPLTTQDM